MDVALETYQGSTWPWARPCNGPGGYFGGDLDALDDCLCGGFGLRLPITIRIGNSTAARHTLDDWAEFRFHAEGLRRARAEGMADDELVDLGYFGDGSPDDVAFWNSVWVALIDSNQSNTEQKLRELGLPAINRRAYFDALCEVLEARRVNLVLETEVS